MTFVNIPSPAWMTMPADAEKLSAMLCDGRWSMGVRVGQDGSEITFIRADECGIGGHIYFPARFSRKRYPRWEITDSEGEVITEGRKKSAYLPAPDHASPPVRIPGPRPTLNDMCDDFQAALQTAIAGARPVPGKDGWRLTPRT